MKKIGISLLGIAAMLLCLSGCGIGIERIGSAQETKSEQAVTVPEEEVPEVSVENEIAEPADEVPEAEEIIAEAADMQETGVAEVETVAEPAAENTEEAGVPDEEAVLNSEVPTPCAILRSDLDYYGNPCAKLLDCDRDTSVALNPGNSIEITAEEDICAIYVIWSPSSNREWTLAAGGEEIYRSTNGFLHEYVEIETPCRSLTFTLLDTSYTAAICDIYIFGRGERLDWVQAWEPPCEQADILLFPTHSDDEYVFFGGVIPKYIAEGKRVQVAYIVDHHNHRSYEMLDSLWCAGVTNYPVVSERRDLYEISSSDTYNITEFQVEQIRRFQPLVVIGHDEDGESGHPLHVVNTRCLKNAVEISMDAEQYPESALQYGVWDVPKTYLHLYGEAENEVVLDYETPLDCFNGKTAFDVAEEAFMACVSQYKAGKYYVNGFDSKNDSHRWGLYRSTVGADTEKNDLFENIIAETYRQ